VNPHRGHEGHGPYVDPDGAVHFFPSLVERINSTLGQELGSHTFSHVSRYEKGFLGDDFFEADLAATSELHRTRFGRPPTSLVFPRNQVGALHVVAAAGIKIYRASPNTWMYSQTRSRPFTLLQRPLRLLDSLNPFVSRVAEVDTNNGLAKTLSSVFLRLNLPNSAWILHRRAIRRGLSNTRPGEIFHIWWHPHNLVRDQAKSLKRVEETLDEIAEYLQQGKLVSNNMGDLLIEGGP
jgi:hypothetical protein